MEQHEEVIYTIKKDSNQINNQLLQLKRKNFFIAKR